MKTLASIILFFVQMWDWINRKRVVKKNVAKELVKMRLCCVDALKYLDTNQNLRANIFTYNKEKERYLIWEYYNMATDSAKRLVEIPSGKGCTGHAAVERKQIWGNKQQIFDKGVYSLPSDQEERVSRGLEWICSTPVMDEKHNVIAVLNFDGNKEMDGGKQQRIKEHAERVAAELGYVLSNVYKLRQ